MSAQALIKYGDFIDRFNRKLSLPAAGFLAGTRVSPNALTLLRSFLIFVAMYLYLRADVFCIMLAGILVEAGDILDYIDGDLARLTGRTSVLGQWLEYLENNFQGTSGSLLGFFICLGLYRRTGEVSIFIILFLLCFGFHMKKALIHVPIKDDSWIFNLLEPGSLKDFQRATGSGVISGIGKMFLWLSTRDINVIFAASVLLPFTYPRLGFSVLYWVLAVSAVAHNVTWLGLAFYQYMAIRREK